MYCVQFERFERNTIKNYQKCNTGNQKFNAFNVEYGIYFTSETGFFQYFHWWFAILI